MTEASTEKPKRGAPWTGRRKVADPKSKSFPIRFTPEQFAQLDATARDAGMSVGAFARAVLLGSPGPRAVRRPPVEKAILAQILGEIGRVKRDIDQIAKVACQQQDAAGATALAEMKGDLTAIRLAIMQALGREP